MDKKAEVCWHWKIPWPVALVATAGELVILPQVTNVTVAAEHACRV